MAAFDLITLTRAEQNIPVATPNTNIVNTLITACSKGIVRHCQREFVQAAYDELYSGFGDRRMFLRHFPLISVQSVRYRPVTVLKIINNNTNTNQQARVAVTGIGITLQRVAGGMSTIDTSVIFASNFTLQAVANAINALGNGWSAQVVGDSNNYGNWPAADLWVPNGDIYNPAGQGQGMLTAAGQFAEIKLHTYELAGYQWDAARGWLLRAIPYTDPELLHPEDLVWPVGINNFRVQYTAGFPTVPEDVQEACAQWVAELYWQTQRDPGLKSETIPGSVTRTPVSSMTPGIIELLKPYRAYKILYPDRDMLVAPNTTCDVYRAGASPPTAPSVAAVSCLFTGIYPQGLERGEGDPLNLKYTHCMQVDMSADVRDDYNAGTIGGQQDVVYVPDLTGTAFSVVYTEIIDLGASSQHKRIYLVRLGPTYPTDQL